MIVGAGSLCAAGGRTGVAAGAAWFVAGGGSEQELAMTASAHMPSIRRGLDSMSDVPSIRRISQLLNAESSHFTGRVEAGCRSCGLRIAFLYGPDAHGGRP